MFMKTYLYPSKVISAGILIALLCYLLANWFVNEDPDIVINQLTTTNIIFNLIIFGIIPFALFGFLSRKSSSLMKIGGLVILSVLAIAVQFYYLLAMSPSDIQDGQGFGIPIVFFLVVAVAISFVVNLAGNPKVKS